MKLRLYVWEGNDVLRDHTSGMICVLATSPMKALGLIAKKYPYDMGRFPQMKYKVYTKPEAFLCSGGG